MSRWLAMGAGVFLVSALPRTAHAPDTTPLRVAVLAPSETGSWLLGARLGMEEARRAARRMDRELLVVEVVPGSRAAAAAAHEARSGTVILVAGEDFEAWDELERTALSHDLVLLDARPRYARGAPCLPRVFRIGVPAASHDVARAPSLWHPSVPADGAAELNGRFIRRFGRAMDGAAWAGWFAVRVAAAAALGVETPNATTVEGFLRSRAATFDGHKGQPLRFDAVDRRLIQPSYVVERGVATEVWWPSKACTHQEVTASAH